MKDGYQYKSLGVREIVRNVVRASIQSNPFLQNFESAVFDTSEKNQRITERMMVDIFDPNSQVCYMLIGGIPGSGKTTFADAFARIIREVSFGLILVERASFSQYRNLAKQRLQELGEEWTKAKETKLATQFMQDEALEIMQEGPYLPNGRRRIRIVEMPVYPVDEKERGLSLVKVLGKVQRNIPYRLRKARVNFIRPDVNVIKNGVFTRILRKSSGGSPDMLLEIANKAYAGALMFKDLDPEVYSLLTNLIRDNRRKFPFRKISPAVAASNVIAVRMLAILQEAGIYGPVDTVLINPARRHLIQLSRAIPQESMGE